MQQKKSDSGNAQYDPAKSDISTVADTAGELVKEMVYMNWQFLSAESPQINYNNKFNDFRNVMKTLEKKLEVRKIRSNSELEKR